MFFPRSVVLSLRFGVAIFCSIFILCMVDLYDSIFVSFKPFFVAFLFFPGFFCSLWTRTRDWTGRPGKYQTVGENIIDPLSVSPRASFPLAFCPLRNDRVS